MALRLARGLGGPQEWQRSEHGFPEAIISRSSSSAERWSMRRLGASGLRECSEEGYGRNLARVQTAKPGPLCATEQKTKRAGVHETDFETALQQGRRGGKDSGGQVKGSSGRGGGELEPVCFGNEDKPRMRLAPGACQTRSCSTRARSATVTAVPTSSPR